MKVEIPGSNPAFGYFSGVWEPLLSDNSSFQVHVIVKLKIYKIKSHKGQAPSRYMSTATVCWKKSVFITGHSQVSGFYLFYLTCSSFSHSS